LPRARPRAGPRRTRSGRHGRRRERTGRGREGRLMLWGFWLWERRKPRSASFAASAAPTMSVLLLLSLAASPAVAGILSGVVFEDANGNGVRDAGEQGIGGIGLSNGRAIVRSAADGSYAIEAAEGDVVFAIKPADR